MTHANNELFLAIRSAANWADKQPFAAWELVNFRTQRFLGNTTANQLKGVFDPYEFNYAEAVRIVGDAISCRARETDMPSRPSYRQSSGRILRHSLRETTYSLTPKEVSGGFFDSQDLPPWDLWIAIQGDESKPVLLSWIPEVLFERANAGVEASAEDCFAWEESTTPEVDPGFRAP